MAQFTFTYIDNDGIECEHTLPGKNEVCFKCEGFGTHLNPSIGEYAYTPEEFDDSFDDEEKVEYFRHGGRYDVSCEECHGNKVVLVPDESMLTPTQKEVLKLWNQKEASDYEYKRECEAERRMGY